MKKNRKSTCRFESQGEEADSSINSHIHSFLCVCVQS